jgi:uncharacterized protein YdeI (YjbR/CyaY-like superfamily)
MWPLAGGVVMAGRVAVDGRLRRHGEWEGQSRRIRGMDELVVADVGAWREWLGEHHEGHGGVWLVLAKKGTSEPTSLSYNQALEEALCHGWIDGQARSGAEGTYVQRFTPRRAQSVWSQRNIGIVARLESEGRMQPAGRAEVERAKADGRWDRPYGGLDEVPDDLAAALASAEPQAAAMFEILTKSNRNHILHQVAAAKRPDTRARRIDRFVAELARGETPFLQKGRLPDAADRPEAAAGDGS